MKVIRNNRPPVELHRWTCWECEREFVWTRGCYSREIIDERGGTLTWCPGCSAKIDSGELKPQKLDTEKEFLKELNKQK